MLTKKYIQKELALRINGIRPNVTTNTDVLIGELKSALMMVDCLPDDEPDKKYNEAMLRADEAVQKGCLDKDMFDIIFPPEESEDERIRNCLRCLTSLDQAQDVIADMGFTRQDLLSYLEKQKEQKPNIEICPHSIKSKSYLENPITPKMMGKAADGCIWGCDDNRFWIIDRAKKDILAKTNIESSPEEMKVLDSFLFRCWQMGWLGKYDVIVPEQKPMEWKPTKEQMVALNWAANGMLDNRSPSAGDIKAGLRSLYNDLQTKSIQPVEWSEEDEEMRNLLVAILEVNHPDGFFKANDLGDSNMRGVPVEELVAWLKSLRPSWKPSEEQMEALNYAIAEWDGGKRLEGLYALRNDLKKLI